MLVEINSLILCAVIVITTPYSMDIDGYNVIYNDCLGSVSKLFESCCHCTLIVPFMMVDAVS
jgi:hypothetical protein